MADRFWTPEQDAALKAHVERNELPYSRIKDEINAQFKTHYTRNATIGRAKRIGCCNPVRKTKRKNQYTTERVHAEPMKRVRVRPAPLPPDIRPLRCADVTPGNVRLIELGPDACKYPVDDVSPFFFCGEQQMEKEVYCPDHFRLTRRA
jgi:GcrA cell cycle regulator